MNRPLDPQGYPNTRRAPSARANPSSTQQNPYRGTAWLGSGYPLPLPQVPPSVPRASPFRPLQYAASRPSYDLAGVAARLGPYFHVPIRVDYNVLLKLRETIPLISAAILRMKELVGAPAVQAEPRLKEDIDAFLRALPVNRMQVGLANWLQSHLDNLYTFGRAHAEVILTPARNDVFGLVEVHPATCALRPTLGGYGLDVVQYQYGGGVPVTLIPELLLTSVNDMRGDDPNGTSLISELPFVAQILNAILRAQANTWDRFGTPCYWVNWEPPATWEDPTGQQTKEILQAMQGNLSTALRERAEGKPNDFFTSGKVTLDIMGAAGETLEFQTTARALLEQILAKFGLPPFMFGFSWSSTERMSTAQAKVLTEIVEASRAVVSPEIERLIMLRQLLVGRPGEFELCWPKVSLQDLIDVSRAEWMDQQALQIQLANWERQVRLGIYSLEEMAKELRPDLAAIPVEQVRQRLPGLVTELPVFTPAPVGGAEPGTPGNTEPGQPPGGNNPRVEVTRGLVTNGKRS